MTSFESLRRDYSRWMMQPYVNLMRLPDDYLDVSTTSSARDGGSTPRSQTTTPSPQPSPRPTDSSRFVQHVAAEAEAPHDYSSRTARTSAPNASLVVGDHLSPPLQCANSDDVESFVTPSFSTLSGEKVTRVRRMKIKWKTCVDPGGIAVPLFSTLSGEKAAPVRRMTIKGKTCADPDGIELPSFSTPSGEKVTRVRRMKIKWKTCADPGGIAVPRNTIFL